MALKAGVLLSGCGYLDGAEIQEVVCTLLALDLAGAEVLAMAPNVDAPVINHLTGDPTEENRNILAESARIVRGQIRDVAEVRADELDVLILPGGFGAAKNLSNFATRGKDMSVHPDVERLVRDVHGQGKPIGAICIAPAIIAHLIPGAMLTIGHDADTAGALEAMGAEHRECSVTEFTVDRDRRIVSTPAYMLGPWTKDIYAGIKACVDEVLKLAES